MKSYFLLFIIFFIANIHSYAANPGIEVETLDFYRPSLEKLPWDEIVVPTKEGAKIKIILKTKGLKEFSGLTYQIKLFRQDDYPNGKFKTVKLYQTKNINEFIGEIIFFDDTNNNGENAVPIPQGDDGVLEVSCAEGLGEAFWESETFFKKLIGKGYKGRGNAVFFSRTDEGTTEEHESEGIPVLNDQYIQCAGVEKIIIDADIDNTGERPYYITPSEWNLPGFNPAKDWLLVKNQADIFYYAFHGEHESNAILSSRVLADDWKTFKRNPSNIVPKKTYGMLLDNVNRYINDEIGEHWNLDLEWVYLAGCSILDLDGEVLGEWSNFHAQEYNCWYDTRPGLYVAKNLMNKNSNLHGLIGFCATGKSDNEMIEECFKNNDKIVDGWKKNSSLMSMYLAPAIIYRPECEDDTFTNLSDLNPRTDQVKYWSSYQPVSYSFPEKNRVTQTKILNLNINSPRSPDILMIEDVPVFGKNPDNSSKSVYNYYPAFYQERKNISEKRIRIDNLTPLLSWGYFSPDYEIYLDKKDNVFFDIMPGIIKFENENMKNYGVNIDGDDDRIITEWQIQVFNEQRKLIIDEIFQAPLLKSDKQNLLLEASYKIKPEQKLYSNSIYYFRVRGKGQNGLTSPFSKIQWFKTK